MRNKLGRLKITYNSPVILIFVAICLIALISNTITGGWSNRAFFSVYSSSWTSPLTYIRLVGHVFGHADWEHFIGNMMLFLLIGPLLEEKYKSKNLAIVIVVTAIATGILNIVLFPNTGLLGASGVVFAFIILSSITSMKNGEIPLTFIIVVVLYIGQEVYNGVFMQDNISNFTHIVGGGVGGFFGYYFNKRG